MNRRGLGECTPTSCPKAGIKIHQSDNEYRENPFRWRAAMRGLFSVLATAAVLLLLTAGKEWELSLPFAAVLVAGELLSLHFPQRRPGRRGRRC